MFKSVKYKGKFKDKLKNPENNEFIEINNENKNNLPNNFLIGDLIIHNLENKKENNIILTSDNLSQDLIDEYVLNDKLFMNFKKYDENKLFKLFQSIYFEKYNKIEKEIFNDLNDDLIEDLYNDIKKNKKDYINSDLKTFCEKFDPVKNLEGTIDLTNSIIRNVDENILTRLILAFKNKDKDYLLVEQKINDLEGFYNSSTKTNTYSKYFYLIEISKNVEFFSTHKTEKEILDFLFN